MIHDYSSGPEAHPSGTAAVLRRRPRPQGRRDLRQVRDPPGRAGQDHGEDDPAVDLRQRAARARPAAGATRRARPSARRQPRPDERRRGALAAEGRRHRDAARRRPAPPTPREALVFVHGNPGSADDWEALVAAAGAAGTRAVAFDLPDFGETLAPPGFEHSTEGYAAFVGEALAALGIERVHLVLHDFGGPIGLVWAMGNPDALAGVVLIDTGILPGYKWHTLARVWRTPVLGELFQAASRGRAFTRGLASKEPRGLPRRVPRGHGRPLRPADQARGAEALPRHRRPGRGRRGARRDHGAAEPAGAGDLGRAATPTCPPRTPSASATPSPPPTSTCSRRAATGPSPTRRRRSSGC